jgi:hypothetical protein
MRQLSLAIYAMQAAKIVLEIQHHVMYVLMGMQGKM